ncbi:unnamed protein product [Paramecium sonneborni]|uniref:Uncharacterized protein n=1 Tax=Paramecium sonneborni TaxID=65129 RepID=A0A8S1Q2A6_9CILI|nr:unnamed protein product [Paramecium sonneborni]CAD8109355.1 unnamed protein product [Paramecium sonneborni]
MQEGFVFYDDTQYTQMNEPQVQINDYGVSNNQFEHNGYLKEPDNKILYQDLLKQSKIYQIQLEEQDERLDYKNLPKLIGNNFKKYIEQNKNQIPLTQGLEKFLMKRNVKKEKNKEKKQKKEQQISTKISDLREICRTDFQSKRIFKKYMKKQFIIDLIHSSKIENPLKYIDGISTYFATADEPEKMISSHIINSKKKYYKKIILQDQLIEFT